MRELYARLVLWLIRPALEREAHERALEARLSPEEERQLSEYLFNRWNDARRANR